MFLHNDIVDHINVPFACNVFCYISVSSPKITWISCNILWEKLFDGTVPSNNCFVDGTVPSNNCLVDGTVPSNNCFIDGTVPSNNGLVANSTPF